MNTITPITDTAYDRIKCPADQEEATKAITEMRDVSRRLESQNMALQAEVKRLVDIVDYVDRQVRYVWSESGDTHHDTHRRCCQELMASVLPIYRASPAGGQLLPMETAPKDGTRVLVLTRYGLRIGVWETDRHALKPRPFWRYDASFGAMDDRKNPPLRWLPLPAVTVCATNSSTKPASQMKSPNSALEALCQLTDSRGTDWEEIDGPESRVGVSHGFRRTATGCQAYVNDDQGEYTIDLGDGHGA